MSPWSGAKAGLIGLFAVVAGVLAPWEPVWSGFLLLLSLFAVFRRTKGAKAPVLGFFSVIIGFALGYLAITRDLGPEPKSEPARYMGVVCEAPKRTAKGYRALVEVYAVAPAEPQGEWTPLGQKVSLSIEGEPTPLPREGTGVIFRARLRPPDGFKNPGTLWQKFYVQRAGITARATVEWPRELALAQNALGEGPLESLKTSAFAAIDASASPRAGGVLKALALGDACSLDPAVAESFRLAGTSHVLAVSGFHLGVVALLCLALVRPLLKRFPRLFLRFPAEILGRLAVLPLLALYCALTGFGTSTVRALIMTSIMFLGCAWGRKISPLALLVSTALLMALIDPLYLTDPGFQLSLAALAGLFWLAPALEGEKIVENDLIEPSRAQKIARTAKKGVKSLVITSFSAMITTLPVSIFHFGEAGLAGFVTNPVVVPTVGVVCLSLALAGVLLSPVSPALAFLALWAAGRLVEWILPLQDAVTSRFGGFTGPFYSVLGVLGAYVVIFALVSKGVRGRRKPALALVGLALMVSPPLVERAWSGLDGGVTAYVFDVGEGFASCVRLPGGATAIIDGGGFVNTDFDVGEKVLLPALADIGVTRCDLVISSHPHPDHLLGLTTLVKKLSPARVWLPASYKGDWRYDALLAQAQKAGSQVEWIDGEQTWKGLGVRPFAGPQDNDVGLVAWVEAGARRILFPADLEASGQALLLQSGFDPASDVLVAPHHGSPDAYHEPFLDAVKPSFVLVSGALKKQRGGAGLESYCRDANIPILTTARDGALKIRLNDSKISVLPANR